MTNGDNKRKHLQFIQDVITRMGGNSFLLKGWSISLITAVIGFAITRESEKETVILLLVAAGLVAVFWLLDAYYLSQERAYRGLYGSVRKKDESEINFSLDAREHLKGYNTWFSAMGSNVFIVFYAPVLVILLFVCSQLLGIDIYIK